MPLYKQYAHRCVRIVPSEERPDGEGGQVRVWGEGDAFAAYIALDTSMEARRAEKEGAKGLYSILVDKTAPICYGDYFRDADGIVYRVTSRPADREAPASASFDLKHFTAERAVLPK